MWTLGIERPLVYVLSDGRISFELTFDECGQLLALVGLFLGETAFAGDAPRSDYPSEVDFELLREVADSRGQFAMRLPRGKIEKSKSLFVEYTLSLDDLKNIYECWKAPVEDPD